MTFTVHAMMTKSKSPNILLSTTNEQIRRKETEGMHFFTVVSRYRMMDHKCN
jgi:hypothetical protein